MAESVTLDELDRRLIHALQLDGRASFSRLAFALGAPERTIARRYHRLRSRLALRVVGLIDGPRIGMVNWFVRIRGTPEAVDALAVSLARRGDTSWIAPLVGATELTCMIRTPPQNERQRSLFEHLATTRGVHDVTAQCLLRPVAGIGGWPGRTGVLTPDEQARLHIHPVPSARRRDTVAWSEADARLAEALAQDARATLPDLAAATGLSQSTVRRRLTELLQAGVLYFEVEIAPALFGAPVEAILWLQTAPFHLAAITDALSRHAPIAYAAVTTGPATVLAIAECPDPDALYEYIATGLSVLSGITGIESALTQRHTKRAGTLLAQPGRPHASPKLQL